MFITAKKCYLENTGIAYHTGDAYDFRAYKLLNTISNNISEISDLMISSVNLNIIFRGLLHLT